MIGYDPLNPLTSDKGTPMAFTVSCPQCGAVLKPVKPLTPGQKVKCPKCGTGFTYQAAPQSDKPKQGPAKAMEMWERLAKDKDFGDSAEMRLIKAEILAALNSEQLKPELVSLLGGIDSWKPDQKVRLWAGMSRLFLNLGMMDEAKQCLTLVADERPNELPTRLGLFQLALDTASCEQCPSAQPPVPEIHGRHASFMTRPIAADMRSHSRASTASCRRPAAVSR